MSTATKQAKTREHNPIPWLKIQTAYEAGMPTPKMAEKFGYFNSKADDQTKEMRGINSRGVTIGFTHPETEKTVYFDKKARLKAMGGTLRSGTAKPKTVKVPKAVKTVKATKAPKTVKAAKAGIVIVAEPGGNFVRLAVPKKVALMGTPDFLSTVTNVVNDLGYVLTKQVTDEPATEATPVVLAGGETVQEPEVPEIEAPATEPVAEPATEEIPEPVQV